MADQQTIYETVNNTNNYYMATQVRATEGLPGIGKFVRMKFDDGETEWVGEILDELIAMNGILMNRVTYRNKNIQLHKFYNNG